jgi:hypothetical protein
MRQEPAWSTSIKPDASDAGEKSPAIYVIAAATPFRPIPQALQLSASGLRFVKNPPEMAHAWAAAACRIRTF